MNERARLKEIDRINRQQATEIELLKIRLVLSEGSLVAEKYEFMEAQKIGHAKYAYPVSFICDLLEVSRSGFYD